MKNSRCQAKVMEKREGQEEDERREAVIASAPSLQPNFEPKGGITQAQLSKFQVSFRYLSSPSMFSFSNKFVCNLECQNLIFMGEI